MQSPIDAIRGVVAEHLAAESDALRARASGLHVEQAERQSSRARAALGTGQAREWLEEAVSTGSLDAASHGALLDHLAGAAEIEVLARHGTRLELRADERVVVEDRERSLVELAHDTRSAAAPIASTAMAALVTHVARDRNERSEAFADAAERGARVRSRGPTAPDLPPEKWAETCASFLDATDDAAADLIARVTHGTGAPDRSLAARTRALSVPALDGMATPRGRADRARTMFAALGLGSDLSQRIEAQIGVLLTARPSIVRGRGRALVITAPFELGVTSERTSLGALAIGLTYSLASPSLPIEHAHPATGSVASAIGALFESFFADPRFVARWIESGQREISAAATVSAAAIVIEARMACVPVILDAAARSDDAARELAARALVLDPTIVPIELARPSRVTARTQCTTARARLAALAWTPALRERYDVDHFRNPRLSDFLRGAAARGGTISAEGLSVELDAAPTLAAARAIELAEEAGG